jgi:hypothetical protein
MEASQQEVETSTQTVFDTTSSTTTENESTENSGTPQEEKTMDLSDVEVTNENVALNIIVSYVNLAQKRGAFNIKESAKIWECIQKFQRA